MKKAFLVLSILFSSFASGVFAQAGLSMNDSSIFVSNDTVALGGQITYTAYVFNNSAQPYTGTITYYTAVDSSVTQGANLIVVDSNVVSVTGFPANDTTTYGDTIFVGSEFKSGINTVVIWPVAEASTGYVTLDSAKFNVFIFDPLKLQQQSIPDQLVLYPNPFSDKIWLITRGNIAIEEVRIVDVLGKTILVDKTPGKQYIETADLPKGLYLIELKYNNGLKKQIKTIKQ